jgi:hypothetical protein
MHQQTIEEAMRRRVYDANTAYDPSQEEPKMAGAKRVRNPNEKFFVWFEDNYGSPTECVTECDTLVEALEEASRLDDEYNIDTDGDIVIVRGERIQVKKIAEFVVDTD